MSLLLHARYYSLGNNERRVEIGVYHLSEILYAHLEHRYTLDNSSVVNQYVDCSEIALNVRHQLLHLLFVGYVGNVALGIDALFLVVG